MKTMDNKQVNKAPQKSARLVLQAVTAIARSNANSLCRGLLYEPNANYAQTECQFRYCGTAIPFLTVRSTAR